ncbi:MAG TPA: DUF2752 domain-containing protein [Vicinamibacterales bacterium]|nr:DUF2752 domain-containing protein [Vicinamibacterales bacterium]
MIGGVAAPPVLLTAAVRWTRARQAAVVTTLLTIGSLVDPDRPLPLDVCLWHRLTGYRCLTCGLTRSVCHALRGDWAGSFAYHPAGIVVLAAVVFWAMRSAAEASSGRVVPILHVDIRQVYPVECLHE